MNHEILTDALTENKLTPHIMQAPLLALPPSLPRSSPFFDSGGLRSAMQSKF